MSPGEPIGLASPSGLSVRMNANGSIHRVDHRDVIVNAYLGNEIEGGAGQPLPAPARRAHRMDATFGPGSPGVVRLDAQGFEVTGEWEALRYRVSLCPTCATRCDSSG